MLKFRMTTLAVSVSEEVPSFNPAITAVKHVDYE
jgi:hypothetical protein